MGSFPERTTGLHLQMCAMNLPMRHTTRGRFAASSSCLSQGQLLPPSVPKLKHPLHRGLSRPLSRGQDLAAPLEASLLLLPALTVWVLVQCPGIPGG